MLDGLHTAERFGSALGSLVSYPGFPVGIHWPYIGFMQTYNIYLVTVTKVCLKTRTN